MLIRENKAETTVPAVKIYFFSISKGQTSKGLEVLPIQEKKCDAPGHYSSVVCSVAKAQNSTPLQIEKHNAGVTTVTCEGLGKDTAALGGEYLGSTQEGSYLRCAQRSW